MHDTSALGLDASVCHTNVAKILFAAESRLRQRYSNFVDATDDDCITIQYLENESLLVTVAGIYRHMERNHRDVSESMVTLSDNVTGLSDNVTELSGNIQRILQHLHLGGAAAPATPVAAPPAILNSRPGGANNTRNTRNSAHR